MAALAEEQTEVAVKLEPEGPPTLLPPQAGDGTGEGGGGTTNNGPNGGGGNVAAAASSAGGDGGTPKPSVAVSAVAPAGAAPVPAAAPEAGAPHDRQTLLAVLQFLRQSNLREAEEALRREARLLEEAVAGTGAPGEADGAGTEAASALLSRVTASAPGPAAPDPPGTGASGAPAVSGLATGPPAPGKGEPRSPGEAGRGREQAGKAEPGRPAPLRACFEFPGPASRATCPPLSLVRRLRSQTLFQAVSSSERLRRAVEQWDVWGGWAPRGGDLQAFGPFLLWGALKLWQVCINTIYTELCCLL